MKVAPSVVPGPESKEEIVDIPKSESPLPPLTSATSLIKEYFESRPSTTAPLGDDLPARKEQADRYHIGEKDIRRIHRLSYFGPVDEQGLVSMAKPELAQTVLVLEDPVQSWSEFAFLDLKYGFTPNWRGRLILTVEFEGLERRDNIFIFAFDLKEPDVRKWLVCLLLTQTISIVNGPSAPTLDCVNIHLWDEGQNLKLATALRSSDTTN